MAEEKITMLLDKWTKRDDLAVTFMAAMVTSDSLPSLGSQARPLALKAYEIADAFLKVRMEVADRLEIVIRDLSDGDEK